MENTKNNNNNVLQDPPNMILAIGACMDSVYRNDFGGLKESANLIWESMTAEPRNPYDNNRVKHNNDESSDDLAAGYQRLHKLPSLDGMSFRSEAASLKSAMKKKGARRSSRNKKTRFGAHDDESLASTIATRCSMKLEDQKQLAFKHQSGGHFADDETLTLASWDDQMSLLKKINSRHIAFAAKEEEKTKPNLFRRFRMSSRQANDEERKKWQPGKALEPLAEVAEDAREDASSPRGRQAKRLTEDTGRSRSKSRGENSSSHRRSLFKKKSRDTSSKDLFKKKTRDTPSKDEAREDQSSCQKRRSGSKSRNLKGPNDTSSTHSRRSLFKLRGRDDSSSHRRRASSRSRKEAPTARRSRSSSRPREAASATPRKRSSSRPREENARRSRSLSRPREAASATPRKRSSSRPREESTSYRGKKTPVSREHNAREAKAPKHSPGMKSSRTRESGRASTNRSRPVRGRGAHLSAE